MSGNIPPRRRYLNCDLDGKEGGLKCQGKSIPDREELIQKSEGGHELGMFQGWRSGQHGWSEVRTTVAGSEGEDAGRILVIGCI